MRTDWPDFPFAPRRLPFFYGWVMLGACTLGVIASVPGQTVGVGVFNDNLLISLRLTSVSLSLAYMAGTIGSSFMLPVIGSLLDRLGARVMVVAAAAGLGVSLLALAGTPLASRAPWPDASFVAVTLAFFMLRFFGQGCLTMTSRVAVGKWFNHRRGLATAIMGVFVSFGFNGSPALLNYMVETIGWRETCVILAVAVGGVMSLIGWLFYRDNPEQCGLQMDGVMDEAWRERLAARVPEVHREFTRSLALRTTAFWAFSMGLASQALIITAVCFHLSSIGADVKLTRAESYAALLPLFYYGVAATFIGGWLSDRVHLKWLLIAMTATQMLGLCGLLTLNEPAGYHLFTFGLGVSGGLFSTLLTVTWPRYFGREHLGAISGVNMSAMVFASGIGPVLFAEGRDLFGNFNVIIAACTVMPIAVMLVALTVENPQDGHQTDNVESNR